MTKIFKSEKKLQYVTKNGHLIFSDNHCFAKCLGFTHMHVIKKKILIIHFICKDVNFTTIFFTSRANQYYNELGFASVGNERFALVLLETKLNIRLLNFFFF